MPSKDRTFSADDVIRIYLYHLTDSEKQVVEQFFAGQAQNQPLAIANFLLAFGRLIPGLGILITATNIIIRLGLVGEGEANLRAYRDALVRLKADLEEKE